MGASPKSCLDNGRIPIKPLKNRVIVIEAFEYARIGLF